MQADDVGVADRQALGNCKKMTGMMSTIIPAIDSGFPAR